MQSELERLSDYLVPASEMGFSMKMSERRERIVAEQRTAMGKREKMWRQWMVTHEDLICEAERTFQARNLAAATYYA